MNINRSIKLITHGIIILKNFSNKNLSEVYESKNVIITSSNFETNFEKDLISDEIKKIFINEIKPKMIFQRFIDYYVRKNFKGCKVLGVHFRGTSYKRSPGHPFPATKTNIKNIK